VILGGYDDKLEDNIQTLARLRTVCDDLKLSHVTLINSTGSNSTTPSASTNVVFLLNFTTAQRSYLLLSPLTLGLLYTPQNEHFGIVPVEAMACGLPVLAVNNGGPTETLVDTGPDMSGENATGLLREANVESWAEAVNLICRLPKEQRERISAAGKRRVRQMFSLDTLGKEMEDACMTAKRMGPVGTEDMFVLFVGTVAMGSIMLLMTLVLPFL
jgi:alpha-1,3/alpha-1,6-mannosyltransferase